jgi:neutral ceramidase
MRICSCFFCKTISSNLFFYLLFFVATTVNAQQKTLQAGVNVFKAAVVKTNITPTTPKYLLGYDSRLSTGIHDSLYNRVVLLDDGITQFVLASTEVCELSPSEYDRVAAVLQKRLGINPLNFWWTVTHSHSAPETGVPGLASVFAMGTRYDDHAIDTAYTSFVENALINAITEARKKLETARLSTGWGFSQANINRRAIDVDGKASLGLNPDGPVDRRIGLIRLDKKDGTPLALIANYPIHGTVLSGDNLKISGDVPGIVADYVEKKTGAPLLFINGAAGNLAPIYSVYPNPEDGHLSQFRVLLGDKILDANKTIIYTTDSVRLFTGAITVEGLRKKGLGWPSYLSDYTRTTANGTNLVKVPVRFLKINEDIALWSAPVELFCEIANEIRGSSPFPFTFFYGYTNGWLGYLPSEDQWQHGGYEIEEASAFTPEMTGIFTNAVTGYLQSEMRSLPAHHTDKKK